MEINKHTSFSFWERSSESLPLFRRFIFRKRIDKTLKTPVLIRQKCEGISFNGHLVKSILFSTDLALIENNDSDAVLAVYPFAPSPRIMETLINFSSKPVICGVGGGKTQGKTSVQMAMLAEQLGACAVIVNQPFKNRDIQKMKQAINIPIISSISTVNFDFKKRIESGVSVFNITGGPETTKIIQHLQQHFPDIPYICTGGKSVEHLTEVINHRAKAVILTPPSNATMFKKIMANYRLGITKIKKLF